VVDDVTVRELAGSREMVAASTLWDAIWFRADSGHEVDPALMVALSHAGGYLAAAFVGPTMVGAALGFWGVPTDGTLHSHITGVLPEHAGRGIGSAIKAHQRDWVLARGGTAITWTFDPLVSRNAHVNLNRLGARPESYLPDLYGDLDDDLNRGDPSDRLLVRWRLSEAASPRSAAPAAPLLVDRDGTPELATAGADTARATALTVAVPDDVTTLRRTDPAAASRWRTAVRDALLPRLDSGWSITGFDRATGYRLEAPRPGTSTDVP
jgi:predicted GNAT superfamily acetyltransferase